MTVTNFKLFENKQKSLAVLNKLNIPENDVKYVQLKELLKNNAGYLGQFTKWLFEDKETFEAIVEIFDMLNKQKIDKPIESFNKLENLYDYLQSFEINQKSNQVFKALPSKARELVDERLMNLVAMNYEFSKEIISLYSKKGGKYSKLGADALYKDTKSYIDNLKGEFSEQAMKEKAKELNVNITYSSPTITVMEVRDYESSSTIGEKAWCIATSKNMWDSYVNEFTKQYFIFDFTKDRSDKKHAIGVTVGPQSEENPNGKYTAIHWADDSTDGLSEAYFDLLSEEHGV
jgi:hypothetical protein